MKKAPKKKTVKAYSLGGTILLVIIVIILVACGALSFNKPSCADSFPLQISVRQSAGVSPVLSDLQRDKLFNPSDYPEKPNDYSLQVIQIAESTDNELMIFVYQPGGTKKPLVASSINISAGSGGLKPLNYPLMLLSSAGTLCKYRVENLRVGSEDVRQYEIISIFRKFDAEIDKQPGGDNTVDEVVYSVAQSWTAKTVKGAVSYAMLKEDVIVVKEKHVGFVRYNTGIGIFENACDSHYIAFSTDRQIDKLMEADVEFITRSYWYNDNPTFGEKEVYGDPVKHDVMLTYTDKVSVTGSWWHKYKWDRIETVKDFTEKELLTDETKKAIANKQFVLRFTETKFQHIIAPPSREEHSTRVSEVTILRLKFETDGKVYDLGVVDNKQSGDENPDNYQPAPWWQKLLEFLRSIFNFVFFNWKYVLGIVLGVIVLVVVVEIVVAIVRKKAKK